MLPFRIIRYYYSIGLILWRDNVNSNYLLYLERVKTHTQKNTVFRTLKNLCSFNIFKKISKACIFVKSQYQTFSYVIVGLSKTFA